MTIEAIKAVREDTTREPMRSTAARQREALESVCAGLRPGEPLPDHLEIAAGFDVLFAPTSHNPFHVRIVAKTHTFDAAGREALALAFDRIVRQR